MFLSIFPSRVVRRRYFLLFKFMIIVFIIILFCCDLILSAQAIYRLLPYFIKDAFMKFRLSPLRTAALVAASLFLAPQGMAADAQNGIVVYNAQHENLVKSWVDGFTKETGIKVTLRNGDDSELGNQLVQEGSASPADVFLTENSPSMVLVDNAKLFAPLDAATLQQVPAQYRPQHGRWIGIAARSTVFVYNPAKISEAQLPHSLMDLAKPGGKGAGRLRHRGLISRLSSARCWR